MCALAQPWQGLVIGSISALVTNGAVALLDKLHIDDPVGEYQVLSVQRQYTYLLKYDDPLQ